MAHAKNTDAPPVAAGEPRQATNSAGARAGRVHAPPDPPEFLCEDAQNEWHRVACELHALGLLSVLDTMPLAAYCDAYARRVTAERLLRAMADKDANTKGLLLKGSAGSAMANPLLKIARHAALDMVRYASEFGLTPVARSRLSVAGRLSGPGKFDGLLA